MNKRMQVDLSEVALGFVVNLETLREVLKGLSNKGRSWWIACDPLDVPTNGFVSIGHGDSQCTDRLNTLYFRVPVISEFPQGARTDKFVVAIDPSTCVAEDPGFYLENDRLVEDPIEDFRSFYEPIARGLIARLCVETAATCPPVTPACGQVKSPRISEQK